MRAAVAASTWLGRSSSASSISRSICRRALGVLIAPISPVTGPDPASRPARVPLVVCGPGRPVPASGGVRPVSAPAPFPFPECPGVWVSGGVVAVSAVRGGGTEPPSNCWRPTWISRVRIPAIAASNWARISRCRAGPPWPASAGPSPGCGASPLAMDPRYRLSCRTCSPYAKKNERASRNCAKPARALPGWPGARPLRVTAGDVRARVRDRLGSVKAPKQVEVWPDLPRSKVGKLLKADIKSRPRPGA